MINITANLRRVNLFWNLDSLEINNELNLGMSMNLQFESIDKDLNKFNR